MKRKKIFTNPDNFLYICFRKKEEEEEEEDTF
jgi:hypothetical protein